MAVNYPAAPGPGRFPAHPPAQQAPQATAAAAVAATNPRRLTSCQSVTQTRRTGEPRQAAGTRRSDGVVVGAMRVGEGGMVGLTAPRGGSSQPTVSLHTEV